MLLEFDHEEAANEPVPSAGDHSLEETIVVASSRRRLVVE
jgi:hypothetical protein